MAPEGFQSTQGPLESTMIILKYLSDKIFHEKIKDRLQKFCASSEATSSIILSLHFFISKLIR